MGRPLKFKVETTGSEKSAASIFLTERSLRHYSCILILMASLYHALWFSKNETLYVPRRIVSITRITGEYMNMVVHTLCSAVSPILMA